MLRWESYRAVYGAELRAAAREYSDHGWPVVGVCSAGLLLATGTALDIVEVPAAVGRRVCAQLREAGLAVPVAATPTGTWWFPVTPDATLPAELRDRPDVVLHTDGAAVLAPPSETPDGWVHWRVAPALSGYRPSPAALIVAAVAAAVEMQHDRLPVAVAGGPSAALAAPDLPPAAADRRSAPGRSPGRAQRCGARGGTSPSSRSRTHLLGRGRSSSGHRPRPEPSQGLRSRRGTLRRGAGTMEPCRPLRRPPPTVTPHPGHPERPGASPSRSGSGSARWATRRRRVTCAG
jgi:hypothetical protein